MAVVLQTEFISFSQGAQIYQGNAAVCWLAGRHSGSMAEVFVRGGYWHSWGGNVQVRNAESQIDSENMEGGSAGS